MTLLWIQKSSMSFLLAMVIECCRYLQGQAFVADRMFHVEQ